MADDSETNPFSAEVASTAATALPQPPRLPNYFVRHWRGDLSLARSYWLNGIGATVLLAVPTLALFSLGEAMSLWWIALFSLLLTITRLAISVWQIVGVWRSAGKHVARGGKQSWSVITRVVLVLGILRIFALLITHYVPQSLEMAGILAGDHAIPAYKMSLLENGTEMEFRGGIRAGSAREFEKFLQANRQIRVVRIESMGGRISEARNMAKAVRERGLTTYTADYCLSAGTFILMAGQERVIARGAKIGFHSAVLPGATASQKRELDDRVRKTMQEAGISETFINRVLATPPQKMWYPSFEAMQDANVLTRRSIEE